MSLLSYNELVVLVNNGVISAPLTSIKGDSMELTLSPVLLLETDNGFTRKDIDLANGGKVDFHKYVMDENGYAMVNHEFLLAYSNENWNMPNDIAAEYSLSSGLAQNCLNASNSNFIAQTFNSEALILELFNVSRFNNLVLKPNMPIGKVRFFRTEQVPTNASYAVNGKFNGLRE